MSELTKTTSTFQLQLKSPAVVIGLLLHLFAFALGIFTAILIDALVFGGQPAAFVPVWLVMCVFGAVYGVDQLLITDCEVIATLQGLLIKTAKSVLLHPRSTIQLDWEDIAFFRSGEIRVGRCSRRTEPVLIISRVKGRKIRLRGGETLALTGYLRGYFPKKEKPFMGEWR